MSGWAAVGQAAGQIGSQLIANASNARRQRKAFQQQKELMDIQTRNQKQLNIHGNELQKEMWDYTNYGNQINHMKEAGLSPGLMYGLGGGGGTTAGSQGGGSAASGSVPEHKGAIPMEIGSAIAQAAQTELMRAQANRANAEADSLRGVEGTKGATEIAEGQSRIEKLIAETANEGVKNQLMKLDAGLKNIDRLYYEDRIVSEVGKLTAEAHSAMVKEHVDRETQVAVIQEIRTKAIGQLIKNELDKAQIEKIGQDVIQRWSEIGLKEGELNLGQERLRIEQELRDRGLNLEQQRIIVNGILGVAGVSKLGQAKDKGGTTYKEKSDGSWEWTEHNRK